MREIERIKTLSMLKMEKNFRAHNEKGYARQPYRHYDLKFWIYRIEQELIELKHAFDIRDYAGMREEFADVSNLIDFGFERTFIEEQDGDTSGPISDKGLSQLFEHNKRVIP